MGMSLHGDDNRANLCICTNMDGGLVMENLDRVVINAEGIWLFGFLLGPIEAAEYVFKSKDLIENPFESGSLEFKQFVDRLLELTSEAV